MLVRGAFNHILRPGLRKDFRDNYQAHTEEFSRYLRVGTQDRAEVEAVAVSGLPRMVKRGEVEPITFLDPVMSAKVTFIDDEYALGFAVSKKLMEDDQYGKANQNAKWLARSARLTQEYRSAALLDDAFAGNTFTGLLGEVLCETAHELVGESGTWSNRIANDIQFGVTGLQAAFDLAENMVDHTDNPLAANFTRLVLNIADEDIAIKITAGEKEPFTADNDVNALMRKRPGLSYVISHYKTQGTEWFFQDPSLMDIWFLFRVKPEFEDDFDFRTKAALFTARQRINVYFFDQRGIIGSNPS